MQEHSYITSHSWQRRQHLAKLFPHFRKLHFTNGHGESLLCQ